jgi:hypothetical protein
MTLNSTCRRERNSSGDPTDVFSWPRAAEQLTRQWSEQGARTIGIPLRGRVVAVKVQADGDLHIALADETGDKPGTVVYDVPCKPA